MIVLESESVLPFDVDDTLVTWDLDKLASLPTVQVRDPYSGKIVTLGIHVPHVKLLKQHKKRGSSVIVWSQGGHRWAKAVVKALDLEDYVDVAGK